MEYNLKNRPKLERVEEGYMAPSKPIEHIQEIYRWFEGFEKELHQLKEAYKTHLDKPLEDIQAKQAIALINEILGE